MMFNNKMLVSLSLITLFVISTFNINALAQTGPAIDVWYGLDQDFGLLGNPQPWINILGNVSGASTLSYSLNGGASKNLTIGPDGRRLQSTGDFNIDIATSDPNLLELPLGPNVVVITATGSGGTSDVTVSFDYDSGNVWPRPYTIDWSSTTHIQDVAQVVDGKWTIESDTVRTEIPGYDRLIAIGDASWDDYEVTVPITVNSAPGVPIPSGGVGILMRWNGHTDNPVTCTQPKCGWLPLGAIGWYYNSVLEFYDTPARDSSRTLYGGVEYIFKVRVETIVGVGGLYSLKVWEDGTSEPLDWDLIHQEGLTGPLNGSMLLISHRLDASFGDVTITRAPTAYIDSISPNPAISGQVVTFSGHGTVSDSSIVAYNWRSDIDGPLSTSSSFSTSLLSVGNHTIYFMVKDGDEVWSAEVARTLVIKPTLSDVSSDVVDAVENDVYFIYPDYQGVKPSGVGYALLSDWTASGFIVGMVSNLQQETTDTDPAIIDTSTGESRLEGETIVLFGGPIVNAPVNYYEDNRVSPVYWGLDGTNYYWYLANGTKLDATGMLFSQIAAGTQDMFILETFIDSSDNKVYIVYGYGWKGTFGGGKFFKFIIYPDISSYTDSYYVFKWVDGNSNGFVDLDEILTTPIVSG
jgi:hypothetical protein